MDARDIVERAWAELPQGDRRLLESIRADQWEVCGQPLGTYTDGLLRSAGRGRLSAQEIARANAALGLWVPEVRVVLINDAHPAFDGLDPASFEWDLSRVAWHEWGHALSLDRATQSDMLPVSTTCSWRRRRFKDLSERRATVAPNTRMRSSPRSARC